MEAEEREGPNMVEALLFVAQRCRENWESRDVLYLSSGDTGPVSSMTISSMSSIENLRITCEFHEYV